MLFTIKETRYDFETDDGSETRMQRYYESKGYRVLNNCFAVVYRPASTKYPEAQQWVSKIFDNSSLKTLQHFTRAVFPGDGATGVNPGQPDLLIFREDASEVFFSEVKRRGDRLQANQMVGISLLHVFLGFRVEIARVNGPPRQYRWVRPSIQQLHPEKEIKIDLG